MPTLLPRTPVIETANLRLRPPHGEDWPAWRDFAMSERARYVGGPKDLGGAWRGFCHIGGMWAMLGHGSFVITAKDDDRALGMAGPWTPADWPEPEIGWTLWSAAVEGRGIAFEAAQAARAYAFETLGWTTAVSYIEAGNARSIALAERLGAVRDAAAACPSPGDLVYRHSPAGA